MLLSDRDIQYAMGMGASGSKLVRRAMRRGNSFLRIDPYCNERLQPASYDMALGGEVGYSAGKFSLNHIPSQLMPGGFVLAHTEETTWLPGWLAARVEGKSSWARKGLFTHTSAGWIDPGFHGQVTLELFNASDKPITLTPGDLICQVSFYLLTSPAERPYGSKGLNSHYQGQVGATQSALDSTPSHRHTVAAECDNANCQEGHEGKPGQRDA